MSEHEDSIPEEIKNYQFPDSGKAPDKLESANAKESLSAEKITDTAQEILSQEKHKTEKNLLTYKDFVRPFLAGLGIDAIARAAGLNFSTTLQIIIYAATGAIAAKLLFGEQLRKFKEKIDEEIKQKRNKQ